MLTVNATGHPIMKHFHRPEDEKRSVVVLNEQEYLPWLKADTTHARSMLNVAADGLLISEAAPKF